MRALLFILALCVVLPIRAQTVTTLLDNGDPANRVDIIILGDGFTAAEMGDFHFHANAALNKLLNEFPFNTYHAFFNAYTIDVVSNESGADHPSDAIYKDTALGATYDCQNIARLICVNNSAVNSTVNAVMAADERDIVLVLVNDTEYGGSGGSFAVASINSNSGEIAIHELGHSFGLLADEYNTGSCNRGDRPNVETNTQRAAIKWNQGGGPPTGWIDLAKALPSTDNINGSPGIYEIGNCAQAIYRPTLNSKMRVLNQAFHQVNSEQFIKRFYNLVEPIDSHLPTQSSQTITTTPVEFSVNTVSVAQATLPVEWYVDGALAHTGPDFPLPLLPGGSHSLEARVADNTPDVIHDPDALLKANRQWSVDLLDTDGDGAGDVNDAFPADPNETLDTDSDGLGDNLEATLGTDPGKADTDEDGATDFEEYQAGSDPLYWGSTPDMPYRRSNLMKIILIEAQRRNADQN